MGIINTLIRGYVYDFSSVHITIDGKTVFCTFQDIDYGWTRDIGKLRGNASGMIRGRTRGEFNFQGSMSIAKSDAVELQRKLALLQGGGLKGGFGEAVFNIIVMYSDRGQAKPDVDTLIGCTLAGGNDSHGRSPDPLVVKYELDIMDIRYNGMSPASLDAAGLAGAVGGLF